MSPMFILSFISRVNNSIARKVKRDESGLYLYLTFPISVAFLVTFVSARIISHFAPWLFLSIDGVHVHHFAYGFFILTISGYLALTFNGPRATLLIAFLHGIGLGLALDEFGMWLHLRDDDIARWNFDGLLIFGALIIAIVSAKQGFKTLRTHFPFRWVVKLVQNSIEKA